MGFGSAFFRHSLVPADEENVAAKELAEYIQDAKKTGGNESQINEIVFAKGSPTDVINTAIAAAFSPEPWKEANGKDFPATNNDAAATAPNKQKPSGRRLQPNLRSPVDENCELGEPPGTGGAADTVKPPPKAPKRLSSLITSAEGLWSSTAAYIDDYLIGEGDVVGISVWGEREASLSGATVRADGKITLPLLHEIEVAGLTPTQLEKRVGKVLVSSSRAHPR